MAYFAELGTDHSTVMRVISISNDTLGEPDLTFPETEAIGQSFIANVLGLPGLWKQTSFNNSFRKRFASVGYRYEHAQDEFVPPGWELVDGEWIAPAEAVTE